MLAEILVVFLLASQTIAPFTAEQKRYHDLTDEEREVYNGVISKINRGKIDLPRDAKRYIDLLNKVNYIQVKLQTGVGVKYTFKMSVDDEEVKTLYMKVSKDTYGWTTDVTAFGETPL